MGSNGKCDNSSFYANRQLTIRNFKRFNVNACFEVSMLSMNMRRRMVVKTNDGSVCREIDRVQALTA